MEIRNRGFYANMGIILLLAVSVSLDVLGISVAYALSGIRIPWNTRIVISAINMILNFAVILLGTKLNLLISEFWLRLAGAGILVTLGSRTLWNALGENVTADYDRDASCSLEPYEGILLGVTLALDCVCAALGICDMGAVAWLFPVMTGGASLLFLSVGSKIHCNLRRLNGLAGGVLIILGAARFFCGQ